MFERYTEKARRTIFFARYEAAQVRSPFIETEHLLLGLMREEKELFMSYLKIGAAEAIQGEIRAQSVPKSEGPGTTNVDLPLSNESKRVLAYASEDAERLHHRHIGTEHLFLGLLRDENTFAGQLLRKHGVSLAAARDLIGTPVHPQYPATQPTPSDYTCSATTTIHGERWRTPYLESLAAPLRRFAWVKQDYQPRDLLIEKTTGRVMFYLGQQFDTERFDLAKGAWPRDHCSLCRWELSQSSPEHQTGYTNGMEWLCPECYERFVAPHLDPRDEFYT